MKTMTRSAALFTLASLCLFASPTLGGDDKDDPKGGMSAGTFSGLKFRSIGPALQSGRICDFAVDPTDHSRYFVAVCSGGVWKTENAGTTYKPIFDGQGSYSVGCVTMDPSNPHTIWVGSGENNSQRSVSFGDGVYRSRDGGKSWKNVGLKDSEHIGMIVVDPRDSNTVYVAAQGPLWRAGGDRGLYKTTDGGENWQRVLYVSEDTGINEVHMDPRDPDVLYASSYQRRRHVWTLINGGPEGAIYKSTDAGKSWRKVNSGLPGEDKGRIGMCISPANPDIVYAIVEAAKGKSGFYRSTNRGESWSKRSGYSASSPQYYNEIVCDPIDEDTVYSLSTFMSVTKDGGKTFKRTPRKDRHVDDHALWINPANTDHLLVGCDGGIYESYDLGNNWQYKVNLPITQFYRVSVDQAEPFYNVYGGTQDNNSQGGPSRTKSPAGITNEDWFITVGGDGYETVIDPEDPNTVYSQWQYGGLIRHDRKSGEIVDIKPRERPGDEPYRWNWDSPVILSPHSHTRLYFAAQRLFRSDDRGNSWSVISEDLTRQIDRDQLEIMGKIQSIDAVAKNRSTSIYGNCVALDESPIVDGLLYVGTDDGVIAVTEDAGQTWRSMELFPGVPDQTYVSWIVASVHDADTVFAAFDNHKSGDFKPYILKSTDRGRTWKSIVGDIPDRQIVYNVQQDHVNSELLFAGTEYGVYFTIDGGKKWIRLKGGLPPIAIKDMTIQRRENDLVLGTFGRGFYILDDYSPLRTVSKDSLDSESLIFPVKPALRYVQSGRLSGWSGRGSQGASYYAAKNPSFGAVVTYYLKDKLKTRKETRQEKEKKVYKAGKTPKFPTIEELRAEDHEKTPRVFLTIKTEAGEVIRRVEASRNKGIHRVAWDLRDPSLQPTRLKKPKNLPPWATLPAGPLALPGNYTVTVEKEVDGVISPLVGPESFEVIPLELATFAAKDREEVMSFNRKVSRLYRAVQGAGRALSEAQNRVKHLRKALRDTVGADPAMTSEVHELDNRLTQLSITLNGDGTLGKHQRPVPLSIRRRAGIAVDWYVTSAPTQTQRDAYKVASEDFGTLLNDLRSLIETDLSSLEDRMEKLDAPWTPGRIPQWKPESE
jgi:photosystem II stability/assembly factor-like uncharacterized protein